MPTTADFLLDRLINQGVGHAFGVPGDYILPFYKKLNDSKEIQIINTTDENSAGFAADGYARINGIGCACVTYNVGASKLINAVQCAYAERSPLVVISGSPGVSERKDNILLHHTVRSFEHQKEMFDNITCASTVLDDPTNAGFEIDRVFEALNYYKRPIYIELPRDTANKNITYDVYQQGTPVAPQTDQENLQEAVEEVLRWVEGSCKPVIMAGVQASRYGLGEALTRFAEKLNIPICSTLLSKSVVAENHNLYAGVYAGNCSQPGVQKLVEESDCLLMIGTLLTDITLNFHPAAFEKRNSVECTIEGLKVKNHTYTDIGFVDFCDSLFKNASFKKKSYFVPEIKKNKDEFVPKKKNITTERFFEAVNGLIEDKNTVVADIGDVLFGATDLCTQSTDSFMANAFYTTMGASIPSALGAQVANGKRPIVLVGDGAFQMCGTELSTIARLGLNPVVFVLNNNGYTTEKHLLEGTFNDINSWRYDKITDLLGKGLGFRVETEDQLEEAIDQAKNASEFCLINVVVDEMDTSLALKKATKDLSRRV